MINRKHRFHGYHSLDSVYRRGKQIRSTYCSLKFLKRDTGEDYRLAVVVSKKVSKSAVVRSRIRRRIYEVMRTNIPAHTNLDMVLTVYDSAIMKLSTEQLNAVLRKLYTNI